MKAMVLREHGGNDRQRQHHMRLVEPGRRGKPAAIGGERQIQLVGREMRGKGEGQTQAGGKLGEIGAGSEQRGQCGGLHAA